MNFFSYDGPVSKFLNIFADLCILNICFLICCLPIFTIGASATALYSVCLKMSRGEEWSILPTFFKAFKQNFKQATKIWIPCLFMLIIAVSNIILLFTNSIFIGGRFLIAAAGSLLILLLHMLLMVFPVLAKFSNTTPNTVKNAYLMGLANLPWLILIAALNILPPVFTVLLPIRFSYVYLFWLIFGFSTVAFIASFVFENKIFPKYIE